MYNVIFSRMPALPLPKHPLRRHLGGSLLRLDGFELGHLSGSLYLVLAFWVTITAGSFLVRNLVYAGR